MKYVSLEDIEKARLTQISDNATEYDKGRVTGWNECIQALIRLANNSPNTVAVSKLVQHFDEIYNDDEEYPDCEECSFSGLLTDD